MRYLSLFASLTSRGVGCSAISQQQNGCGGRPTDLDGGGIRRYRRNQTYPRQLEKGGIINREESVMPQTFKPHAKLAAPARPAKLASRKPQVIVPYRVDLPHGDKQQIAVPSDINGRSLINGRP